ncbi:L domain-like protein [Fragilariopsis cylindrus CCMP1102]|uniref:L domain-like protein n=1 Tax=Fragilariopsis cylindrus CCMP1102 TaxID=635003 RepID=A0A1E7FQ51_9STRA|nr:L domain-like protein [Fragilariopsis cylindrus CCMP1102]|eukprot:OEU20267.1 L domain-like protein [Fragilariopsis cylindrus CCMP1102]
MAKQQSSYGGRWILDDEQQKMIFVVEVDNRPIPNQIVRLPDPPTDCDNSQMIMSDGSITMTSFDHDDDHDDANKIYEEDDDDEIDNSENNNEDYDDVVVTEPITAPTTSNDNDKDTNTDTDIDTDTLSTLSPTVSEERTMMIDILTNQFHITVLPSSQAINWLLEELQLYPELKLTYYDDLTKFAQRFALVTMKFSLLGDDEDGIEQKQGVDECNWYGIECDFYGRVIEVDYSDNNLSGSIPSSEIKLLYHLETLDLSNNEIIGSIPEEIYDLRSLQHIYLYHNKLTGTISSYISQLLSYGSLQTLHLSHNSLTGSIPSFQQQQQLDSSGTSSLTYLNLYDNKLTGTIPRNLRLNELKYFDIGRNFIGGSIPEDIGIDFLKLRYLHIDHNRLTDNIPDTIPSMANGRLISFLANNNRLEGYVPDNYIMYNKLVQYTLQNNYFDYLGPNNCFLNVFQGGELVEFKADCNICSCDDIFCNTMCS